MNKPEKRWGKVASCFFRTCESHNRQLIVMRVFFVVKFCAIRMKGVDERMSTHPRLFLPLVMVCFRVFDESELAWIACLLKEASNSLHDRLSLKKRHIVVVGVRYSSA